MTARAKVAAGVAAVVVAAASAVGYTTLSTTAEPSAVAATPESFGVKFTLKGCAQRASASTRVGGKGVLVYSGDADWWVYKTVTLKTNEPGADIVPPYLTGYTPMGQWTGYGYGPGGKGGKYQMWWASRNCPGSAAGTFRGDSSILTITVLPKV